MVTCPREVSGRNGLKKRTIQTLEKGIKKVTNIVNSIAVVMLFILMVQGGADVIGRYLFDKPIIGTMERGQVLLGLMVLLSWGYTQIEKGHVSVDFFIAQFSARTRAMIHFCTTFMVVVFFSLIVWQGLVVAKQYHEGGRIIYVIHWPLALFQLCVPVSAFFLCLVLIMEMIQSFYEMKKRN
jgi:TRAP-type C4-dicarboxylate transport system permease small subunit